MAGGGWRRQPRPAHRAGVRDERRTAAARDRDRGLHAAVTDTWQAGARVAVGLPLQTGSTRSESQMPPLPSWTLTSRQAVQVDRLHKQTCKTWIQAETHTMATIVTKASRSLRDNREAPPGKCRKLVVGTAM